MKRVRKVGINRNGSEMIERRGLLMKRGGLRGWGEWFGRKR